MSETPSVTAVLVAFGPMPTLLDAIDHVLASEGVVLDVVVVDNGADAEALDRAKTRDRVRVLAAGSNLGFGAACNLAARASTTDYLAFVNPDVIVDRSALCRLVRAAADPGCGIASASVRLLDRPNVLNSAGGAIHFLGLGWADGYLQPVGSASRDRDVMAASGACMLLRRDRFQALGGFTEELFLYHEDAELSLRCWQRGWAVRYVAQAVALHDYDFGRNPRKLHLLERNRLVVVATCYSARMLALLAPALVVYELGITGLAFAQGWGREKVTGWAWLVRHRRWLRRRRKEVQAERVVSDRDLAPRFAGQFTGAQVALPSVLQPADRMLGLYWKAVARWL